MAVTHLNGTQLAPEPAKVPLNRLFIYIIGFVFILAMHLYLPNQGKYGLALPFNSTTWIAMSFALATGLYQVVRNRKIRYSKLSIGLFICCALLTLPVLYPLSNNTAIDIAKVLPRLGALWAGWVLFFTLQQFVFSNLYKQRLLWFILIATLIESVIGYIQLSGLLSQFLAPYSNISTKPYGIFQHPDTMASFLLTGTLVSGFLLTKQAKLSQLQRKYGHKVRPALLLHIVPLINMPLVALLTYGYQWVTTIIAILTIVGYLYRSSISSRLSRWVACTVSGIGIGMILASPYLNIIQPNEKYQQEEARSAVFPQAADMLIEKPFTGYGYGKFEPEYMLYTARQHQLNASYPSGLESISHPLNETLYWGVEGGAVTILAICIAILLVSLKIQSAKKGTRLALLGLFLPIAIHSQLGAPFLQSAIHWFTFVVFLYWVDQATSKYKFYNTSTIANALLSLAATFIPLVISCYAILALQTSYTLQKFANTYPRDTSVLQQTIAPIAQKTEYDWQLYSNQLKQGLLEKDEDKIRSYIVWSLAAIKREPQRRFYVNLILAYQGIAELSKAQQIKTEASLLFPNFDFSTISIEPVIEPSLGIDQLEESEESENNEESDTELESENKE